MPKPTTLDSSSQSPQDPLEQSLADLVGQLRSKLKAQKSKPSRSRCYQLLHSGGSTPYSQQIEEILNLDRQMSGLPLISFPHRQVFSEVQR